MSLNVPGRLCNGILHETIVKAPFTNPEPPSPAIDRPTISIFDDVETPQSSDPSSKIAKKAKKMGWYH